ncbi:MAG: Hsp20 family protein [Myxococcales bacterium]|nr:Hsp20 family protein [Myxococcales bacterium]
MDVERVESIVKDGVLTIKVPRAAPTAAPRTIPVTTA